MYKGLFTWYQNEFHSGMSFVPEWSSYCIHMTKSTGSAVLKTKTIKQYGCVTRSRIHGLRFHLGTEFVFSLHDTRMKCHTRTRISFGLITGNELIPEWLVLERNFVSVLCKTDTEKYMGMEWSRSGMTVIPISCEWPLSSGTATRRWTKSGQISRERPHKMPGNAEA